MPLYTSGPHYSESKPGLAAYSVRGCISDRQCTLCFVVMDNDMQRKRIEQNYASLFSTVMDYACEKFKKWDSIPLYICYLQPTEANDAELNVSPSGIAEDEMEKVAQRVLADTAVKRNETLDGEPYIVTYYDKTAETGFYDTTLGKAGWSFNIPVSVKAPEDLKLIPRLMEELDQFSSDMYLTEIISFIEREDPEEAFHSFSHYALLTEPFEAFNVTEALETALSVTNFLISRGFYDYADWAANWAASLAAKHGKYEAALDALRLSGIANEGLFRINELKAAYEKAAGLLDNRTDPKKAARLYMSYGISLLVLAFCMDVDGPDPVALGSLEQDILSPAQAHLEKALSIFNGIDSLPDKFPLRSIELELIRIDDLRGNHQRALAGLENLMREDETVKNEPRLSVTALVYAAAAARHLYKADPAWEEQYFTYLQKLAEIVPYISSSMPDKACYICIWTGDELSGLGNPQAAVDYYSVAYDIQQASRQNEIRSADPGTRYGGILAIDISGRIQNSLLGQQDSHGHSEPAAQAFAACESEKCNFFRRALIFRDSSTEHKLTGYLKNKYQSLRSALSTASIDQRLLMSDYRWFLKWDAAAGERARLESFDKLFNEPLSPARLQKLLSNEKTGTALVSFYVTDRETLVYIVKGPSAAVTAFRLGVDSSKLKNISQSLHTGIYGNEYYQKLTFSSPEKSDKFFQPLFALSDDFLPLIQELSGADVIYLCPHGLWHSVPIHMLLLPALWREGKVPAVVYTPSIHLLELLQARYSGKHVFEYRNYGLTTVPTDDNPETPFQYAHNAIYDIFKASGATVTDCFGREATADETMKTMNRASLYHIIAHGSFLEGKNAMNSGLLLSEASGLPRRNQAPNVTGTMLMLNGTAASHITLQACSLGKRSDQGNEFWGFTRAAVSAGANSVIAPLWDIDIRSSTRFLELFYNNWLVCGQPKWKAWANAQFSMFSEPTEPAWSHFIHWAAFQLIGYCGTD